MQNLFKKAKREQVKLKIAITGPTGSGKTYSALRLAKGFGGKIAVIDTENGSASLYSDSFDFDVINMQPPFATEKYIDAINCAEQNGYTTILIDSLTHAWAGEGGLLEQKALLDSRPGSNHWTNWGPIDKKDQALKNAFLHSTCHIICTMRSKMEYSQTEENGKKKIQKLGLAPIQRDGLSYDFSIVFDLAMDHMCEISKDRTGLFDGKIFKITEETGNTFLKWLDGGVLKEEPKKEATKTTEVFVEKEVQKDEESVTSDQDYHKTKNIEPTVIQKDLDALYKISALRGWSKEHTDLMIMKIAKTKPILLTVDRYEKACEFFSMPKNKFENYKEQFY